MSPDASPSRRGLIVAGLVALAVVGPPLGFGGGTESTGDESRSGGAVDTAAEPAITGIDRRFVRANRTATVVRDDIHMTVPSEDAVVVGYRLTMNDVRMATAERRVSTERDTTVPMTVRLPHDRVESWWVSHMRNGQRTTRVVEVAAHSPDGDEIDSVTRRRTVETDVLSGFNSTASRPLGANVTGGGAFLYVEETAAWTGSVEADATVIEVRIDVYNPNTYPVPYYGFGYEATMNGVVVGESDAETRGVIQPRSTRTVRLTVTLDHDRLDEWWRTHLDRGETTRFRISFSTRAEATSSGVVDLSLDSLTHTRRIETGLFVDRSGANASTAQGISTGTNAAGRSPSITRRRPTTSVGVPALTDTNWFGSGIFGTAPHSRTITPVPDGRPVRASAGRYHGRPPIMPRARDRPAPTARIAHRETPEATRLPTARVDDPRNPGP